ncbi:uncharacterized protein LOC129956730 [Argiope bruennichi]|uniref:uncharacterized protein LOC129956730 n=1 Tax=Argiope bruennichi TaxID=94029 RepID=UPI0024949F1F|nr:uncharacterized protein LOC129956730 [Argiope bruennichi]
MYELEAALSKTHDTSPGPDGITQVLSVLPSSVHGTLYVDDLQISCQGCSINLIERQLQNAVNKVVTWCNNNGHAISPEKSRCIHFCRKRTIHSDPNIYIQNVLIPVVSEVRFLGVIFDRKLTFLPHILNLRKRCEKTLNILKVLSRTSWGADRTSLLRIYQAIILSRIDYGCMVYGSARPTVLRRLDTIHDTALRICSGAFRTSPVESLYVICHQLPLNLRRKKISVSFYFRTQSVPHHPICCNRFPVALRRHYGARPACILPFCERIKPILHDSDLNDVRIKVNDPFMFPPWDIPQFSFLNPFTGFDKSSTAPVVFQQLFLLHRYRYSSFVPIFTDGSKSAGHKISPSLQRNFIIYSDSMSALEMLSNYSNCMHPIANRILLILRSLKNDGFNIIFCWVSSHVDIPGNEKADSVAKSVTAFMRTGLPFCDVKVAFSRHINSSWQEAWGLQIHNKLHSVKPIIGSWPVLPIREIDVKLTRLRIGHTRYTHRHLIFGDRKPVCPTCHVDFSTKHILIECPILTEKQTPVKSSDSDTEQSTNSAPETHETRKRKPKPQRSLKLKLSKRGLLQEMISEKLKSKSKSKTQNSVALELAKLGIAHKDLISVFGNPPQTTDLITLHPSEGDEDCEMS